MIYWHGSLRQGERSRSINELKQEIAAYVPDMPVTGLDDRLREILNTETDYAEKISSLVDFICEESGFISGHDGEQFSDSWGHSLSSDELKSILGLTGTCIQVFDKDTHELIAERR
jgi:hypothetical protein